MTVASMLRAKPDTVIHSCKPDDTLELIAKNLSKHRIGAILIINEKGKLEGIVSERDIVRMVGRDGAGILNKPASEAMTRKLVTCTPTDTVTSLMGIMTQSRVRHIPVIVDDEVVGVVSIGDVVKARIANAEREAAEMMEYITSGI